MKYEKDHESVDSTLPKLEPLIPGANIPLPEPPELYESHQNPEKLTEEFLAKARARKGNL